MPGHVNNNGIKISGINQYQQVHISLLKYEIFLSNMKYDYRQHLQCLTIFVLFSALKKKGDKIIKEKGKGEITEKDGQHCTIFGQCFSNCDS